MREFEGRALRISFYMFKQGWKIFFSRFFVIDFLQKDVRKMPEHTEQQTVTYICPGCGSYLRFDGKAQGWACD